MLRAKSCTQEKVKAYFSEHTPHKVVGPKDIPLQRVRSSRSFTTTLIACARATGVVVPPYFVFKGKRDSPELTNGCLPGRACSMSDSGWSNSVISRDYLEQHFIKNVPNVGNEPAMILYDGHKSHVCAPVVEWARQKNIVLYVLPPHSSNILQPLDIGMFGPLKRAYNTQVSQYLRKNVGQVVSRYSTCQLISKVYLTSMTPANAVSAFRKAGTYTLNPGVIQDFQIAPSQVLNDDTNANIEMTTLNQETNNKPTTNTNQMHDTDLKSLLLKKLPKFTPPFKKNLRQITIIFMVQ